MIDQDTIKKLAAAVEHQAVRADEAKEDLNSAYAAAKAEGLDLAAFKASMKLRKLDPHKLQAWLDTFDRCREALGLDAQMDIEDALDPKARRAAEKLARMSRQDKISMRVEDADGTVLTEIGKPN